MHNVQISSSVWPCFLRCLFDLTAYTCLPLNCLSSAIFFPWSADHHGLSISSSTSKFIACWTWKKSLWRMFPQKPCLETQGKVGGKPQGFIASMEGSPYAWFHSPFKPNKEAGNTHCLQKKLTDCINLFIYICFSLVHVGLFSNDLPQHLCPLSFQALPKNQQTHRSTEVEVRGIAKPPPLGEGWGSQISKVTGFFWTPNFGTIVCIHIRSLKSWCLEIWCKVTFGGGCPRIVVQFIGKKL